ncbi:MAG: aminopeptidase [Victivallaceae bacterium]|nr:aminopeptidase [Victivallaceae bacterium]
MDRKRLESYAWLLVEKGINPDVGQDVVLTASFDQIEFVRMVVENCYRRGAGKVVLNWTDMPLAKIEQRYQSEERLSALEPWEKARWQYQVKKLPCRLWLDSDDPDGMAGVDMEKQSRTLAAKLRKIKPYRNAMENKHQWCIAAVPGKAWAQKVFPKLPAERAEEKLWEAILSCARANGDPIRNWEAHNRQIHHRCKVLNAKKLVALEYRASNGTDFKVGLIPDGIFCGAAETDLSGREFNPNIPSEEIFTSPARGVAEGLLVASKPLSWQGALIEDFSIRFHRGKAVEVKARTNQKMLEKMISMDKGAAYLGECALISYDSPINQSGILFYNTLFDENACCHIALGRGFDNCVADYAKYTPAELRRKGINDSMIHVDFMIGTRDLEIDGVTASGKKIPVFRKGTWCF